MVRSLPFRKTGFSLVTALALLLVTASAGPVPNDHFRVRIKLDRASLDQPGFKQSGEFFVTTEVTNISRHQEQITAWGQPGWSWVSENNAVKPGVEALQNVKTKITLAPDQKYSTQVEMWMNPQSLGPVRFRMGFVPNAAAPASSNQAQLDNWGGVFWSNAITIKR